MTKNLRSTKSRLTRRLAGTAAAVTLATGLAVGGAGTAHADSNFTIHISPNSSFGLLLDVPGASHAPYTGIIQWYANGGLNQQWTFISLGGTLYKIINNNSGECITTDGRAGDDVYQLPCDGSAGQQWYTNLSPWTVYAWTIWNPSSNLYMDVKGASPWAGAHIDTWYFNGGSNQYFVAL